MTATWKTFCQDPRGWVGELTLEADDAAALLDQVGQVLDLLGARGYRGLDPYTAPTAARVAANLAGARDPAGGNGTPTRSRAASTAATGRLW